MITTALSSGGTPRKGVRDWVMDGAATCGHISCCKEHFENLEMYEESQRPFVSGVGGSRIPIHGRGDVRLRTASSTIITLQASYAPDSVVNLFAIREALSKLDNGAEHRETARSSKIVNKDGKVLVTGSLRGGLLYLDLSSEQDFCWGELP